MRLPAAALIAALVIAAAGSVIVTMHYKQVQYTVNATGLAGGQGMTVRLGYVPYEIYLLGDPGSSYAVTVTLTGARFDVNGTRVDRVSVTVSGNQTVVLYPVVDVTGPVACEITVVRAQSRPPVT